MRAHENDLNDFLANDPNQKAKRLARALVSDMVAYLPQNPYVQGFENAVPAIILFIALLVKLSLLDILFFSLLV